MKPARRVCSVRCAHEPKFARAAHATARRLFAVVSLLIASVTAFAQSEPEDAPESGTTLVDRDFGVSTREFGLERRVEMYQWRADGAVGAEQYQRVWNSARIDSSGFAPGHDNPSELPLASQRWWSQQATLDGMPLDITVLRALGEWRDFRPSFSQLPGNLAATFQPEGDGLSSSENPLDPQIGDLRLSWSELVLPPLAGKIELRDGSWRLVPEVVAAPAVPSSAVDQIANKQDSARRLWLWLGGGIISMIALLFAARRRRSQRKP